MEASDFLKNFEAQFDDVAAGSISMDTELESIDEWGSLQALAIIAMLDSKYNVNVTAKDINEAITVEDIYKLASKQPN